jgi:hypothetical protein
MSARARRIEETIRRAQQLEREIDEMLARLRSGETVLCEKCGTAVVLREAPGKPPVYWCANACTRFMPDYCNDF